MAMEKNYLTYYMRYLQQNYIIYIALVSISKNIETIHISSQYELVESDTTMEYARQIVEKIIAETIEKESTNQKITLISENSDPVIGIWQYIKTYKPLSFIF